MSYTNEMGLTVGDFSNQLGPLLMILMRKPRSREQMGWSDDDGVELGPRVPSLVFSTSVSEEFFDMGVGRDPKTWSEECKGVPCTLISPVHGSPLP